MVDITIDTTSSTTADGSRLDNSAITGESTNEGSYGEFTKFVKEIYDLHGEISQKMRNNEQIKNVCQEFLVGVEKAFINSFSEILVKKAEDIREISAETKREEKIQSMINGITGAVKIISAGLNFFGVSSIVGSILTKIFDPEIINKLRNKDEKKDENQLKNDVGIEGVLETVDFIMEYIKEKYGDKLPPIRTKDDFINVLAQTEISEEWLKNQKKIEPLIGGVSKSLKVKAEEYEKYLPLLKNRNSMRSLSSIRNPWDTYKAHGSEYLTPEECKKIYDWIIRYEIRPEGKKDFIKSKFAFIVNNYQNTFNEKVREAVEKQWKEIEVLKQEVSELKIKDGEQDKKIEQNSEGIKQNSEEIEVLKQELRELRESKRRRVQEVSELKWLIEKFAAELRTLKSEQQQTTKIQQKTPDRPKSKRELIIEKHKQERKSNSQPSSFVERIKNSDGTVKTLY